MSVNDTLYVFMALYSLIKIQNTKTEKKKKKKKLYDTQVYSMIKSKK